MKPPKPALSLVPPPGTKPADLLIVGCGNLLRGDDAVGPLLVRHLIDRDLPSWVRLADGGTAGMDVAFSMRGVKKLIIVDACQSGDDPGAIFKVPGEVVEDLPPVTGLNMHSFRWDNALAFGRWLLKDEYPQEVVVYLIEAANLEYGETLSPQVEKGMDRLIEMIVAEIEELKDVQ